METLKLMETPKDMPVWLKRDVDNMRERLADTGLAFERDGVRYWHANGRVVPTEVYQNAYVECPKAQRVAYEAQTRQFLDEYLAAERDRQPSAEEQYEMRAAFGTNATVVNVLTGRRWRT